MSISPEQKQLIRQIASNRGLIEAIKEYRRLTNASLRVAKDAVEAIIRDAGVGQPAPVSAAPVDNSSKRQQIMELIGRGRKIDAIKLYRQWTNAGLKEAKDYVEAIEAQMTPSTTAPSSMQMPLSNDPFSEEDTRSRRLLFLLFVLAACAVGVFLIVLLWNGL
jgi:ribosomal protein L7/L12